MDLSSPGAELLGPSEADALRVLARQGDDVSGRQVARLAGGSPSSIRRALERLEQIGLVRSRRSSHAVLYRVNREHVFWAPIESILTAPAHVEAAIGQLVADRMGERATVAMFGSVARRESTAESDVDVALVFADEVEAAERESMVDALTAHIEALTGNRAQVVELSRTQLQDMAASHDPLIDSFSRDAITLTGPSLSSLLAAA